MVAFTEHLVILLKYQFVAVGKNGVGNTKSPQIPLQHLIMEKSNLSIQLPLVLIRATENVKKKKCIPKSNVIQLLDLVYTVQEETFNGLL